MVPPSSRARARSWPSTEVTLRQAAQRNATVIAQGRIELLLASVEALPDFAEPFDRAFAVNVHMFWKGAPVVLRGLAQALRPGATVVLTQQPRQRGATVDDTLRAGDRIAGDLQRCDYQCVRIELLPTKPVPAVCVAGVAPVALVKPPSSRIDKK